MVKKLAGTVKVFDCYKVAVHTYLHTRQGEFLRNARERSAHYHYRESVIFSDCGVLILLFEVNYRTETVL